LKQNKKMRPKNKPLSYFRNNEAVR
jgi:hypothetical protein